MFISSPVLDLRNESLYFYALESSICEANSLLGFVLADFATVDQWIRSHLQL